MTDASALVVPQLARVYLAPVGTLAPDGPIAALDAEWRDVGLFTPDSLQFNTDPSFEEARSHQSNWPVRRWQTQMAATAQVNLQEWNGDNFRAVYGGGQVTKVDVTTPTAYTYYRFDPPQIGDRNEFAAILEIIDGTKHYRRIIPRAEQNDGVELSLDKTNESTLPLRISVIGSDIGSPFYDVTDDENFMPAA